MSYRVGLIGGIATGKSTIAKQFAALGAIIIDTDHLAKQLCQMNTPYFNAIVKHFGNTILLDGKINTSALQKIIFQDKNEKTWLEKLLHPPIRKKAIERSTDAKPYAIIMVPLLLNRRDYLLDTVIQITCCRRKQIERLKQRNGINQAACLQIINNQPSQKQQQAIADMTLHTNNPIEQLQPKLKQLHQQFSLSAL